MIRYATLAEYKNFVTARGQTSTTDTTDDGVIESLLEQASRYIDSETGRVFAPFVQLRYFDTPNSRELLVDDDLLEVITVTTGGVSLASTEYNLIPKNFSPAYGLKITDVSAYYWTSNALGSLENAIELNALWGFHDKYSRDGWKVGTTTAEAIDTSETEFDVTASTLFLAGQVIRIGNELMVVSSTTSGKINVTARGDNGSTAAAHDTAVNVYIWQPMKDCNMSVLEMARVSYERRFGKSVSSFETVTAAGVVLSPKDFPSSVRAFIATHKDMT